MIRNAHFSGLYDLCTRRPHHVRNTPEDVSDIAFLVIGSISSQLFQILRTCLRTLCPRADHQQIDSEGLRSQGRALNLRFLSRNITVECEGLILRPVALTPSITLSSPKSIRATNISILMTSEAESDRGEASPTVLFRPKAQLSMRTPSRTATHHSAAQH